MQPGNWSVEPGAGITASASTHLGVRLALHGMAMNHVDAPGRDRVALQSRAELPVRRARRELAGAEAFRVQGATARGSPEARNSPPVSGRCWTALGSALPCFGQTTSLSPASPLCDRMRILLWRLGTDKRHGPPTRVWLRRLPGQREPSAHSPASDHLELSTEDKRTP